jgi:hypothetical protein
MGHNRYSELIFELGTKFLGLYQTTASQFNCDIKQIGLIDKNIRLKIETSSRQHNADDDTLANELLNIRFPCWNWKSTAYQLRKATNNDFDPIYTHSQVFKSKLDELKAQLPRYEFNRSKEEERAHRLMEWQKQKFICLYHAYLAELEQLTIQEKAWLLGYQLPKKKQTKQDILKAHYIFVLILENNNASAKNALNRRRYRASRNTRLTNVPRGISGQQHTHKKKLTDHRHITDWMLTFESTNQTSDKLKESIALIAPILGVLCAIIVVILIVIPNPSSIVITVAAVFNWCSYIGYLPQLIMLVDTIKNLKYKSIPNKSTIADLTLLTISLVFQIPTPALNTFINNGLQLLSIFLDLIALLILTLSPIYNIYFARGEAFFSRKIFTEHTSFLQHVKASTIYHYDKTLIKFASANLQLPTSYIPLLKNYLKTWPRHTGRHHCKLVECLIGLIDKTCQENNKKLSYKAASPQQTQAQAFYTIIVKASSDTHQKNDFLIKDLEKKFAEYKMNPTGSFARRMKYIILRLRHQNHTAEQQDKLRTQSANPHGMFNQNAAKNGWSKGQPAPQPSSRLIHNGH